MHRFKERKRRRRRRTGRRRSLEEPGCSITSTGIAQRHVEKQTAGAFRPGDRTESTVTCEQLVSLKRYHPPLLCENTTN
jgi:hypothetical protein